MRALISTLLGLVGLIFFSFLLFDHSVSELSYIVLVCISLLIGFGVYAFPRLAEIDLKNLRLTLREVEEATSEARDATKRLEEVKREVAEMYGGIERLRKEPFVLDDDKQRELGASGKKTLVFGSDTMRYPAGCIKRERERLAGIFVNMEKKTPQQVAEAILDGSKDDLVFKWMGPEAGLDVPPKSLQQKEAEKKLREKVKSAEGNIDG